MPHIGLAAVPEADEKQLEYDHEEFVEAVANYRRACCNEGRSPSDEDIFSDFIRLQDDYLVDLDSDDIHKNSLFFQHSMGAYRGQSFYASILNIEAGGFIAGGVPAVVGGSALLFLGGRDP